MKAYEYFEKHIKELNVTDDSLSDTQQGKLVYVDTNPPQPLRTSEGAVIDSVGKVKARGEGFNCIKERINAKARCKDQCFDCKYFKEQISTPSVFEVEVWNAAIEAAALSMDDYGFQISSAIIRRLKK